MRVYLCVMEPVLHPETCNPILAVGDLITPSVPNRVVLDAPVVTKDNVEEFIDLSFES